MNLLETLPSSSTMVTVIIMVVPVVPPGGSNVTIKSLPGSLPISSSSIGISMQACVMPDVMVTLRVPASKSVPAERGRKDIDDGRETNMEVMDIMKQGLHN